MENNIKELKRNLLDEMMTSYPSITRLLVVTCMMMFCSNAIYAQTVPDDEIWYTSTDGKVVTPFRTDGLGATIVSNTYTDGKGIIKFNAAVTSLGTSTFDGCFSLASISMPNTVKSIGSHAFDECTNLASVTLSNAVTSIGDEAFYACSSLSSVALPASVTSLGNYVFSGCSNLSTISVEAGNTVYDSRNNCNAIIATASNTLLAGCKNTIIPNTITTIGNSAFYACSSLTSITIPSSVTSVGSSAFYGCTSLPVIDNVRYADTYLIGVVDDTQSTYTIKEGTKWIGSDAFWGCTECTSITLPNMVTSIGSKAFQYCSSLASINIPNSVTSIGKSAFYACSSLTSINIPNSVTSIDYYAFQFCSKLSSVTLGNSVASIGEWAFAYCSKLSEVYFSAENIPTGSDLFYNAPLSTATLCVPQQSISDYQSHTPWNGFGTIVAFNVYTTDLNNVQSEARLKANDSYTLSDNIKRLEITETIPNVSLTYTRNFTNQTAGHWQAWYMPCDFAYDDLKESFDVAEIAGVLFDQNGENYVAFKKMSAGTIKAHTPYVVRAKEVGDAVVTTTTTLQPTSGAKSFSMQSAYNNFTFGGVYENSNLSAEYPTYALSKTGNFALMGSSVYLRPLRIFMRISDRDDNPYAAVTAPSEVKVVVLGEDETGIEDVDVDDDDDKIYNLAGQKINKLQKGINIVNGRKVLY